MGEATIAPCPPTPTPSFPWDGSSGASRFSSPKKILSLPKKWTAARVGAVAADYSEEAMSAYMKNAELAVGVDVGVGRGRATMWTCDLTKRYVEINGDYRS